MPAICWGPVIGAKVIPYRTAVVIGIVFQAVGMLAFGSETYTMFSGMLEEWSVLQQYPARLTLYVLMWIQVTPVILHALSIWQRMLLPGYIATSMLPHNARHVASMPRQACRAYKHTKHQSPCMCKPFHISELLQCSTGCSLCPSCCGYTAVA